MSIIGLTGPTGAGKSTVRECAEELGFFTVDCDAVARVVAEETEVISALCDIFGQDICENGAINRKKLASRAFSSEENTALLNETILPFIRDRIEKLIEGKPCVLLDAPTLFESGVDKQCSVTVAVIADEKLRKNRIISRDNLSVSDANTRLSAAKSDAFFKERCDYIIENNGSIPDLKLKAKQILSKYITEEN